MALYVFSSPSHISQFSPRKLAFVSLASAAPSEGQVWERPQGGTNPGVESTHVSHKKIPILETKILQATFLPVSSVLLPLVVVVLWQVLGGGGSA